MPDHQGALSLELSNQSGFYSRLELIASGRMPLNDSNSSFSKGYSLLNGTAGYRLKVSEDWYLDAMLRLSNLADVRYASMVVVNALGTASDPPRYFYPGLPRRIGIGLTVRYRIGSG